MTINLAHQVADGLEGGSLHPDRVSGINGGRSESVIERGEGSGRILPAISPTGESETEQILPIEYLSRVTVVPFEEYRNSSNLTTSSHLICCFNRLGVSKVMFRCQLYH